MNNKISWTITILMVFIMSGAFAQEEEMDPIITDRPDQTEATTLTPKGWFQVETGFLIEKDKISGVETKEFVYNTTLLKYGISARLELRLIQEILKTEVDGDEIASGAGPLAIGARFKLAEESGIWPDMAFIGHLNYKTGADAYKTDHVQPDFRFTFAHTLSETFALSYNLGAEWNGFDATTTGIYTLSLAAGLGDKFGVFVEVYGFMPTGQDKDHRFDGGFTYLLSNNFQLDLSAGIGLSDISPDNFVSGGLSWRFGK